MRMVAMRHDRSATLLGPCAECRSVESGLRPFSIVRLLFRRAVRLVFVTAEDDLVTPGVMEMHQREQH